METLRKVNLNLLPILAGLLRARTLRHAAEQLHLSPSATSAALARLRLLFEDDLLISRDRRLQPTRFASRLADPLEKGLRAIAAILGHAGDAEPDILVLRRVNLNLLPFLCELLRRRHVTRAAELFGVSQPAMSDALKRLRALLRDEILVSGSATLTPWGTSIASRVEEAMHLIEELIYPTRFDPAKLSGSITIATADYVMFLLAPVLAARASMEAPGLALHFQEASGRSASELRAGQIDIMIYAAGASSTPMEGFEQQTLFEDEMVWMTSATVDTARMGTRVAVFNAGGRTEATFGSDALRASGNFFEAVTVPSYLLLPFLVAKGDSTAIAPRRLAEQLASYAGVRMDEPPIPLPAMRIVAAWSEASTHDPAHAWFRDLLFKVTATPYRASTTSLATRP